MSAVTPSLPEPVPAVDVAGSLSLLASGAVLIDVREQNEWDAGHAPHAVHIPLSRLSQEIPVLSTHRPVVVVCRSGRRSAAAVSHLRTAGIHAVNLDGGMHAWQLAGADIVAAPGLTPTII